VSSHSEPAGFAVPSGRARELVAGAYDLHVHVMPDVFERKISDLELARRFADLGLGGFVLKSHYTMTAERAAVVSSVTGVNVLGSITLNWAVGGINPVAVDVCARVGGRLVWMPTFDSWNESQSANNVSPVGRPPAWLGLKLELAAKGIAGDPIHVVDEAGRVPDAVRNTLKVIAEHGLVLCTGHLSRDEVFALVPAAREEGVKTIVVTHPEFPSQRFGAADQATLAEAGCLLERCFGTPFQGRVSWEEMFANIRAAGIGSSLLSSDLGQVHNPPVEDGIALMADALLAGGFSEEEVSTMAVRNTRLVAGADGGQ
jgi:Family of unknown function (DUF6282)